MYEFKEKKSKLGRRLYFVVLAVFLALTELALMKLMASLALTYCYSCCSSSLQDSCLNAYYHILLAVSCSPLPVSLQ